MLVRGVVVCSLLGAGILHAVPHLCFLVDHDQEQWLLRITLGSHRFLSTKVKTAMESSWEIFP